MSTISSQGFLAINEKERKESKGDNRGRQYPHDYYDRYPPNGRYHSWDSSSVLTGFYSIYSDSRCLNNRAQQINDDSSVSVSLRLGKVIGTYVYLCDGPGVNEHDRPDAKPNQPPKIYKNLTIFFGIPYALPPTPEDDRRFRSDRGPRNSSWQGARSTPVVGLEHHTGDSTI
ncbi:neuroligin-4, X-linked [Trichonephila clavipes]|nr:neuroligin-4, X-linked [Trichonephila clavipes]